MRGPGPLDAGSNPAGAKNLINSSSNMFFMRKDFVILILVALTVLVSGCASVQNDAPETGNETPVDSPADEASNESDDEEAEEEIREIVVEGGNYYFDSDSITVEQGETVRFVFENVGGTHDLRIPALTAGTSVIQGEQSESFEVTFDETGTFDFICSVGNHAEQGMTGTITAE